MKVFLVEDSPLLRARLEAMLKAIPGVHPVGHAADAVVLDIQLAQGSGFDVLRAVRSRARQIGNLLP